MINSQYNLKQFYMNKYNDLKNFIDNFVDNLEKNISSLKKSDLKNQKSDLIIEIERQIN